MEIHYLKNILPDGGLCAVTEYGEHNINGSLHPTDDAHIHDYCEVYFNVSGNVSFAVENKVYPVNTGDIIISKPNEIHYCIYHSDQIHTCYCFWVKASAEYSYLLSPFLQRAAGEKNRITLSRSDKEKLRTLFDSMLACQDKKPMSAENLAAVVGVLDIIEKNRDRTEPSVGISARLGEILEYTDNNFGDECSVNMLCENFFISRSSLYRAFRDELDITPSKYIENRRLANAKKLLERGESVQAAAEKSGFPDYSHFISLFKKRFSTTPKKFQSKFSR